MSQNNSTYNYSTTKFQVVELKQKIKVTMPDDFLDKVKYLCRAIPKVEWSGILFYKVDGTIKDPKNMEITLLDILPMDKGTNTFTEYKLDNRFVDYLMDNPEAMGWKVGHVHSHNTMGVFFSSTDMGELHDNSPNYDFYLSLIVNNFMDFTAKIATIGHAKVETIVAPFEATDENGETYSIDEGRFFVDQKRMFVYDTDISSSREDISVPDNFKKGVDKILVEKKPVHQSQAVNKTWKKASGNTQKTKTGGNRKVGGDGKPKKGKPFTADEMMMIQAQRYAAFYTSDEFKDMDEIEQFAMGLFNFSGTPEAADTLESLLELMPEYGLEDHEIARGVVNSCVEMYSAYYPGRDVRDFVQDIEELNLMLQDYVEIFPFLEKCINSMEALTNNIQKDTEDERVTTIK